ncbi:MAG: hypothetical protein Q9170_003238 [Blastenia crenularia]
MSFVDVAQKIEELSDLELGLLLAFVANEHYLIQTEENSLDALGQELQLITSNIYSRVPAFVECSKDTNPDDLINGLLVESRAIEKAKASDGATSIKGLRQSTDDAIHPAEASRTEQEGDWHELKPRPQELKIADVVILKNLNLADYDIQIQALELMRSRRIDTATNVFTAPKGFCIAIIQDAAGPALNKHLNDHIFMSHYHDPEDGFTNLEASSEWIEDDRSSSSSIVRRSVVQKPEDSMERRFSKADIQDFTRQTIDVTVTAEVKCYLQNVVTFLRMHRAVDGGITPRATIFFDTLVKYDKITNAWPLCTE